MNRIILGILLGLCVLSCAEKNTKTVFHPSVRIPIGQNTWISHNQSNDQKIIREDGIRNWEGTQPLKTYFYSAEKGKIQLGLDVKSPGGKARLKVSLNGETHVITLDNKDPKDIYVGSFKIEEPGYQQVTIQCKNPGASKRLQINNLLLGGEAAAGGVDFVKDNFHFGRRGPSVHLRYPLPKESGRPVYFYSEIEVPPGNDVIGSYFMADGFAHGYFGMQVNSASERRILFSVWSPYDTQNPDEIPKDQRIELMDKGDGVHTGKFGNEGSGGQSYKEYMWKPGTTYGFLLKGIPVDRTHTDYAAYFFAPERATWELIARFRRPKSGDYLSDLYSFLENFVPATGDTTRKALYKNQWIYTDKEKWIELTHAEFTADATAGKKDRLDYSSGVSTDGFYLKNCGFFNNNIKTNTFFDRKASGKQPNIDFTNLP